MMTDEEGKSTNNKFSTCWLIVFSSLGTAASITLVVLLTVWGNIGIIGSGSVSIGTCGVSYFSKKFSKMTVINFTVFIGSCIASLALSILLFVFIGWVCINRLRPSISTQVGLFILTTLSILTLIPSFGYYVSFLVEFNQCSNNTLDFTNALIVILLAAVAILMAFLILAMIISQNMTLGRDEQYRQMSTQLTEQNQYNRLPRRNNRENYLTQYKSPVKVKEQQYTKEKIHIKEVTYESPQKRRTPIDEEPEKYMQNDENQLRKNFLPPQRPMSRSPHLLTRNPRQNLAENLHPDLRNMDPRRYLQINKSSYTPEDDQSFMKQSRKYHDYDQRGILSRGEFEERERRRNNQDRDDWRNRERERHYPQKREREDPYYSPSRGREDRYNEYLFNRERVRGSPYDDGYRQREGIIRPFARNRY